MSVLQRIFGVIPLGIGLTVLASMWGQNPHAFGAPHLSYKIFMSLIAGVFCMIGTLVLIGQGANSSDRLERLRRARFPKQAEKGRPLAKTEGSSHQPSRPGPYRCPHCGAPLGSDADVSPLGDVRCGHCDQWFNIHRHSAPGSSGQA